MPNLIGLNQSVSDSIIVENSLLLGNITKMLSTTIPAGQIISQVPEAGYEVPVGTEINLVISSGKVNNIALKKSSGSDSEESSKGNTAGKGNDGDISTRWCANDGNENHWWQVDLGSAYDIAGTEVTWEFDGQQYNYIIQVSSDNSSWRNVINKRSNTSTAQTQQDIFTSNPARYVRITITGLPSGVWASFWEFKVFVSAATGIEQDKIIPAEYNLYQNYPNPFNPSTNILYALKEKSKVRLVVYDVLGREIKVLVNEIQNSGKYSIDFSNDRLASGIYFYRLITKNFVSTKKMLFLK